MAFGHRSHAPLDDLKARCTIVDLAGQAYGVAGQGPQPPPLSARPRRQKSEFSMSHVTYKIVQHDGGWAYTVDGVFSETFATHAAALVAAGNKVEASTLLQRWPLPESGGDPLFQSLVYPEFMELRRELGIK